MTFEPAIASSLTNLEAEQELLGAMLLDNLVVMRLRTDVAADDFADPRHARICRAIFATVDAGRQATPVTLKQVFETDESLKEVGGTIYLARLAASATTVINAGDYAWLIRDLARRRAAVDAAKRLIAALSQVEVEQPATDVIGSSVAQLREIAAAGSDTIRTGRQVAVTIMERMVKPLPCRSTGLRLLDRAMDGGLYTGRCYGVIARKKRGKSILLGTVSLNLAIQHVPHLYVALEMGAEELMERQIGARIGRSSRVFRLKAARESEHTQAAVARQAVGWSEEQLFVDAPGCTLDRLKDIVETAIARFRIEGVILDYMQLIQGQGRDENQTLFMDRAAQWMATSAKKDRLWWLVAGQENQTGNVRGGEGMRLAFDQVYRLDRDPDGMDELKNLAALTMLDSRYTEYQHVGEVNDDGTVAVPGLRLLPRGPIFVDPDADGVVS